MRSYPRPKTRSSKGNMKYEGYLLEYGDYYLPEYDDVPCYPENMLKNWKLKLIASRTLNRRSKSPDFNFIENLWSQSDRIGHICTTNN